MDKMFQELFGDCSDDDENDYDETGKSLPSTKSKAYKRSRKETWRSIDPTKLSSSDSDGAKDYLGKIKMTKPLVSSMEFARMMQGKQFVKLEQLKAFGKKQTDSDWVTLGILVNKTSKTSANGNDYVLFKLNNLEGLSDVSLFLFGSSKETHWKLPTGSVIALLNASIMGDKRNEADKKKKSYDTCSITIDDVNKLLVLGTAKELNFCQALKKDGHICNQVTRAGDEFCSFHVTSTYRKFTSQRSELQSTFSNPEPEGLFFGNNYGDKHARIALEMKKYDGAQMKAKKQKEQDKLSKILSNCNTRAAGNLQSALSKTPKRPRSSPSSSFLTPPTSEVSSAREILNSVGNKLTTTITPTANDKSPALARGYHVGQSIHLNISRTDLHKSQQKQKAIGMFKKLATESMVNAAKSNGNKKMSAIMQRVTANLNVSNQEDQPEQKQQSGKEDRLRIINQALQAKSVNGDQFSLVEREAMGKHFNRLEKKEERDLRLEQVKAIKTKTITCNICKYTSQSQGDYCKSLGHEVSIKSSTKRFFACAKCKHRLFTFDDILPSQACKNCGGTNFEKAAIKHLKTETKLDGDLLIRGEEIAFLNSVR